MSEAGRNTDDNLEFVSKRILCSEYSKDLLKYYKRIYEREPVLDNELDPIPVALKLSGLVKADDGGILTIRNLIYQRVFDKKWIKQALAEQEPISRRQTEFLYDVFISYSVRDGDWVQGYLLPRLKEAGLRVWSDTMLKPGTEWLSEIEIAVELSRTMLVILSPDSVASQWVSREATAFFLSRAPERRLIPILLKRTGVPYNLQRYQWIDFTQTSRWETAMEKLVEALHAPTRIRWEKVPDFPDITSTRRYNTAAIRALLISAFDDDELAGFIYDYFPAFYKQRFVPSDTKNQKIQQLILYVDEHGGFDQLLDAIATQKPHHYDKFRGQLEIRE